MKYLYILIIAIGLLSCQKDEVFKTSSSINIINAVVDLPSIKVNPSGQMVSYTKITDIVNFSASKMYFADIGRHEIVAVSNIDTTKIVFKQTYDFQPGFYTAYLTGHAPNIDTMFRKEIDMPFIKTDVVIPNTSDNVTFMRFVNLSPNSPALKINIKNSIINEVDNFSYKGISAWKPYDNKLTGTTNYIFEVRNATTNAILLTYTFGATSTNKFKNVALVIKGLVGGSGTNALGIFPSNYF